MEQTETSVGKSYAYEIKGGVPLKGDIDISGSKNAALGVIAASIMVDGVCTLENVPDILDVHVMFEWATLRRCAKRRLQKTGGKLVRKIQVFVLFSYCRISRDMIGYRQKVFQKGR